MIDEQQLVDESKEILEELGLGVDKSGVYSPEDFGQSKGETQKRIEKENAIGMYKRLMLNNLTGEKLRAVCDLYLKYFPEGQHTQEMIGAKEIARMAIEGGIEIILNSLLELMESRRG